MKLTEYFLKVCESCLSESEEKLKTHWLGLGKPTNNHDSYFS